MTIKDLHELLGQHVEASPDTPVRFLAWDEEYLGFNPLEINGLRLHYEYGENYVNGGCLDSFNLIHLDGPGGENA